MPLFDIRTLQIAAAVLVAALLAGFLIRMLMAIGEDEGSSQDGGASDLPPDV